MEDMERRIERGDLRSEKLDAIQVCLVSSLAKSVWLISRGTGYVRDSFGSSEEVDSK